MSIPELINQLKIKLELEHDEINKIDNILKPFYKQCQQCDTNELNIIMKKCEGCCNYLCHEHTMCQCHLCGNNICSKCSSYESLCDICNNVTCNKNWQDAYPKIHCSCVLNKCKGCNKYMCGLCRCDSDKFCVSCVKIKKKNMKKKKECCLVCGYKYKIENIKICLDCGKNTCIECTSLCDCGNRLCDNCEYTLCDCCIKFFCKFCMSQCSICNNIICQNCYEKISDIICNDCTN
jgi:hypothetical protein